MTIRKCCIQSLPGMLTLPLGLGDDWIGSEQWEELQCALGGKSHKLQEQILRRRLTTLP